ncbi:MAG: hypothetical protein ACSLEY_03175 [Candidatus Saccharimonadales bacterium]
MDYIKKHGAATGIIAAVVLLGGLFIYNNQQVDETQKNEEVAVEREKKAADEKKAAEYKKTSEEKSKTQDYNYKAVEGDNYTYLARKALQAYAAANGVTLEKSQVIAAETKLAEKAAWTEINVDQNVTLTNSDLKTVVDEVKALSVEQKAAWDVYSPYVVL